MKLWEGYVFTGVCDSVHRGEYLTRSRGWGCLVRYTPPDQVHTPLGPGTPSWDQVHPPGTRYTPHAELAWRYGQRAGGTHLTGMQSCVHLFPHAMCPNLTCVFNLCLSIFMQNIYLGYETNWCGGGCNFEVITFGYIYPFFKKKTLLKCQ